MFSMTGYGKAEYINEGINLVVEIKSINNKNLDVNFKMPRVFIAFEDKVRKVISKYITRGRVDLFVNFLDSTEKPVTLEVNVERAIGYYNASKKIAQALGLENDFTVANLMRIPEIVSDNSVADYSYVEETLLETVEKACKNLNEMRNLEGEKLVADMLSRMEEIKRLRQLIVERAPQVVIEHKNRLKDRIEEALANVKYDEAKLLNEVAFFTDKSNIDEELTRLNSHINQFEKIVKTASAGKKLDFLMQEFNRETNTICSKANDIEVTNFGLLLKNEIEKVREQVQNLE